MQSGRFILSSVLVLVTAAPSFGLTHARRGPTSSSSSHRHASSRAASHPAGPRAMDSDRAMQKLQADNGWQTKLTPDSRALIKLGLGPKEDVAETGAAPNLAAQPPGQLLSTPSSITEQP